MLPWLKADQIEQLTTAFTHTHAVLLTGKAHSGLNVLCLSAAKVYLQDKALLQAGTHPDLHVLCSANSYAWLAPELQRAALRYLSSDDLSKTKLSRQISVDTVRKVVGNMSESAMHGGSKLLLIYQAENMNRNAANALLKFLEEPTANSKIILISHDVSKLLATVRSRCMKINITPPEQTQVSAWLAAQFKDKSDDQIQAAMRLARSEPLLAVQYLRDDQHLLAQQLQQDFNALLTQASADVVSISKRWLQSKQTGFILSWVSDYTARLIKHHLQKQSADKAENQKLSCEKLFKLYDYSIQLTQKHDGSADEALLLEDLILTISATRAN